MLVVDKPGQGHAAPSGSRSQVSGMNHPNYEIFEKLGEGSTAAVYRAHDLSLKREVAIKMLNEKLQRDPRRLQEFWEEAQFLAGIRHENIVHVHALDKE